MKYDDLIEILIKAAEASNKLWKPKISIEISPQREFAVSVVEAEKSR